MRKILLFLLPVVIAGCASLSYYSPPPSSKAEKGEEKTLRKALYQKFDDLPLPQGVIIDAQNSFIFQDGGIRIAHLKCKSKLSPDVLIDYFKEELPLQGWNLINVVEYGERRLSFQKNDESLIILIYPEKRGARLVITLTPKSGL